MEAWAVVEHEKPLQKISRPIPEPIGKQVLIKVTHCGLCHSDLHFWEGYYDLGQGKKFFIKDRGVALPRAIGHEVLGNIAKLGPDAPKLEIGARRIVYPWIGCGTCTRCSHGDDNMCAKQQRAIGIMEDGGFAQYVVVPDAKFLIDPGNLDPAVACTYACSGITVLSSIQKIMPLEPDDPIVLVGAGGLGLSAIAMLRALGHKKIVSVDISEEKRKAALDGGATDVVDSKAENAAQQIQDAAGAPILGVIDFVNITTTAALAFGIISKGGRMVGVGVMGGEMHLSNVAVIFKAATIMGNYVGSLKHLEEVTKLGQEGKLLPIPITKMKWEDTPKAFEMLQEGKATGRIVLEH